MKRFGAGPCIHCGKHVEKPTGDHIFPAAWYPDSTPAGIEKWQAPACEPCNADFGRFERRLFQRLALGVSPSTVGGEGIGARALRSFDPRTAKDADDRLHREAARQKVRRRLQRVRTLSLSSTIFPNVGTIHEPIDGYYSIDEVEEHELERLICKFVRGISYIAAGHVLPPGYSVGMIDPDANARLLGRFALPSPRIFERGAGFRVERYEMSGDAYAALFHIYFWGKYEFWGYVMSEEIASRSSVGA